VIRERTVWWVRLATWSLALAAVTFWQRPGRMVADTDVGLMLDPVSLIGRAWRFWDTGQFGFAQEPLAGLVPVAAFFTAGDALHVPAWVTQRAWWSIILVAAFLGIVRLTGALGIRSQPARIVAGLGYALSPLLLAGLEVASAQVWPVAVAPWVLAPVVRARAARPVRRSAALSALAVAVAGAANPVAAVATAVPAALFIVVAPGWPGVKARLRFGVWWGLSVVAATAWWWGPSLLALRYASPEVDRPPAPDPLGWAVVEGVAAPLPAIGAMVLATLGVAGLLIRRSPARRAMVGTLLAGVVLVLAVGGDFGTVVALPLAVGLASLAAVAAENPWPAARVGTVAVAGVVVIAMGAPGLVAAPERDRSAEIVPDHWVEVSDWLRQHAETGRALLVPSTTTTVFRWGTTAGEPLAALAPGLWATQDGAVGPVQELVDAVEARLTAGLGGAGLVRALEQAGITHLVVRNDLDRAATGAPSSLRIYQAIQDSSDLTWVGSFGERTGTPAAPDVVADGGLDPVFSAVDVFRVGDPATGAMAEIRPLPSGIAADGSVAELTTVVLSAPPVPAHDCAPYGAWWRCGSALAGGEMADEGLDRQFEIGTSAGYRISGEALPGTGPDVERLLRPDPGRMRARATSRSFDAPVGRPQSVVDADPGTSWVAARDDSFPEIELSWSGRRAVRGLTLEHAPGLAASRPSRLLVMAGGASLAADVGPDGEIRFDRPIVTDRLTVRIIESTPVVDRDSQSGATMTLPPGISELHVLGADDLVDALDRGKPVTLDCGRGPDVVLDGRRVQTSVDGTVGDILAGRPMQIASCNGDEVHRLGPGTHRITVGPTRETRPLSLFLEPADPIAAQPAPELGVHEWAAAHRVLSVGDRAAPVLLAVRENQNPGWQARLDGVVLERVSYEWAQAYLLPPGPAGFVVLDYLPETTHRDLIVAGVLALAVIVGLAAVPGRRSGRRSGSPRSDEPAERGLDVPVAQPGERDGHREGSAGKRPEVSGERGDVEEPDDHQKRQQVVEEDAVRDVTEPPHRA